ncbi:putative endonuclease I [Halobacteriovorax marinus SJ]|uniref:Endonuclease I n=1 Tax=Halobacteriovorax marinus (strain ATCC BAA-682 / DSM 15412 / SJ) TaxID=862908 RepID=E1X5M1_HALMS|nr:endonuclease [Halobacteriovorax marinus]CBW25588.1 putative endonuclease I [Halobacteriovorax marinus SJ]
MKAILALFLLTISLSSQAASNYYPSDLNAKLTKGTLKGEQLKEALFNVLSQVHTKRKGKADILGCTGKEGTCYSQKVLGYRGARKVLFGKLHLEEGANGYYLKDVYCRKVITSSQTNIGPNRIPNSNIVNCEHTWPQSKFSRNFEKEMQKSDLHHLYPTDSKANSIRGNFEFGNVDSWGEIRDCEASHSEAPGHFEPPTEHKGNVARALFYFSVRYRMPISAEQEQTIKEWHIQDPVDAEERERNDGIYAVQGNRNPFIDYPELVDHISNF